MKKNSLAVSAAMFVFTGILAAQVMVINFDDASNPFSNGTISTDYSVSGSSSLYFGQSAIGSFDLPAEYQGQHVQISMQMLDLGKWAQVSPILRQEGPRLGVAAAPYGGLNTLAMAIYSGNGSAPSNANYVLNQQGVDGYTVNGGTWFGVTSWSGTSRIALGDTPATYDGTVWTNGTLATPPVWMQLTWDIEADGTATISSDKWASTYTRELGDAAARILIHGGRNGTLAGVYIDDVTITVVPEPGTFALALGALGLLVVLVRRRR